jgi:hypothetical protein
VELQSGLLVDIALFVGEFVMFLIGGIYALWQVKAHRSVRSSNWIVGIVSALGLIPFVFPMLWLIQSPSLLFKIDPTMLAMLFGAPGMPILLWKLFRQRRSMEGLS